MTLYLKYRPQTIEELDLEKVKDSVQKILESDNLPHAWLLTGTRGTGKTSTARIVAKYVNCEASFRPCNKCEMCTEITAGRAVDIVEIDAASNRGIDDIRNLKEKIALAPMKAKYKIFIIDEAHMLTVEAENALLKTLEEPPENTLFFLCTTEEDKLLPTVISRCVKIEFGKPSPEEIRQKIIKVAKMEKFQLEKNHLEEIIKKARGSFRDAIKILEQLILTGNTGHNANSNLTFLVLDNQQEQALKEVEILAQNGANFRNVIETMVEELHQRVLQTKETRIINMIEGLQIAYERTKQAVIEQLPLEIWIIENTMIKEVDSKPKVEAPKPQKSSEVEKANELTAEKKHSHHKKYTLTNLTEKWLDILKKVKPMNHSVEALLRSTKPIEFDGEKLTLEVFYQFHYDKLNTDKCRQIVEVSVGEVFENPPIKLFLRMGKRDKNQKDEVTAKDVEADMVAAAEAIFNATAI